MKKWIKIKALMIVMLAVMMGIPQNLVFAETPQEPALKSEVKYDESKKKAEIKLMPVVDSRNHFIKEVLDPYGTNMDLNNLIYEVSTNGEYTFTLRYIEKQESTGEASTGDIAPKEETIKEVQEKVVIEEIASVKKPETPSVVSTTGTESVDITIDGYDPTQGDIWKYADGAKTITVTADFGDSTSENKTLEVYLPRGVMWTSIPVVEGKYDTTKIHSSRLENIDKDPLYSAITYIDLSGSTAKKDFSQQHSGSVIYTFTPGTEKVTLHFKASVDVQMIYSADMTLREELTAKLGKGSQSNLISEGIRLRVGGHYGNISDNLISTPSTGYAAKVFASTDEDTYYNETNKIKGNGAVRVKATFFLHYPEKMTDPEVLDVNTIGGIKEVDKSVSGVVKIEYSVYQTNSDIGLRFSIPKDAKGVYKITEKDYAEIEYFDGTKQTLSVPDGSQEYSFEVIEGSSLDETMHITGVNNDKYVDNSVENAFSHGPIFIIDNSSNIGNVKNQTVEFNIDSNWQVARVHLPFDGTISDNTITNLQYKTNKKGDWQNSILTEKDMTNIISNSKIVAKRLTKADLRLDSDEYITGVKYIAGTFSRNYNALDTENGFSVSTYGKLDSNVNKASVTLSFYDEVDKLNTLVSKTGTVQVAEEIYLYSYQSPYFSDNKGNRISNLIAGSNVKLALYAGPHFYHGNKQVQSMRDIIFYLREEDGFHFQMDTLEIKDQDGKTLNKDQYSIIERQSTVDGKTIYEIRTRNTFWAGHYGENEQTKMPFLSISVITDPKMKSQTFNLASLINYTGAYVTKIGAGTQDIYDMNGNGSTSDRLLMNNSTVQINKNANVLVETFLSLAGQGVQKPYIEGDSKTLSYFTPGTQADYLVNILNNTDKNASAFDAYVPIPKEGQNFGTAFQNEDFKWNMKLGSEIVLSASDQSYFDIYYATQANGSNYQDISIYSNQPPADLSQVNMVLIKSKVPIPSGHDSSIKVPLVIDETLDSATDKIGTRNIYNPVYKVTSETFIGTLNATKVGSELVIAEISGTMFEDKDGNGLYNIGMDTPISGHTVHLYKLNDRTKTYEPVLDDANQPVTTVTDMNGKYQFDYNQNLGYETYAVSFGKPKAGEKYTVYSSASAANTSNVINQSNFPNQGDDYEGWIIGIDATKPQSTQLNAGIVKYDSDDLAISGVESTYAAKERKQITISPTITPGIFDEIKDPNKGYQWELVNASDSQYVTLVNRNEKNLKVSGQLRTPDGYAVDVKLTIRDIYGNTREVQTEVTVDSNEAPEITVPSVIEKNVGDLWDASDPDIFTVEDDHDGMNNLKIEITDPAPVGGKVLWLFSTKDTGRLTEAGTYQITYNVTDSDGNTTTEYVVLKVNGLPYLKDDKGNPLDKDNMPDRYIRVDMSTDPFENVHAYYEKASDKVGTDPVETEIDPTDERTGKVAWQGTWDKDDTPLDERISEAGKYRVAYKVTNHSHGSIDVSRTVYARGAIKASAQGIAIRDDSNIYDSLDDFLAQYNGYIDLQGSVDVTDANGEVTKKNLTTFEFEPDEANGITSIRDLSFARTEAEQQANTPKSIQFHVRVYDRDADYGDHYLRIPITLTIQSTTGEAPAITFKDKRAPTQRKTSDKVLMEPETIITQAAYDSAKDLLQPENHTDPHTFYNKLISDAIFEDKQEEKPYTPGIARKGIARIAVLNADDTVNRILINSDEEAKQNQDILMKLYTEVGHYEVTYFAEDEDGNYIENARHIHTAGETVFTGKASDKEKPADLVQLRTDTVNEYQPSGIAAYHIDYDGVTRDVSTVYDPLPVDISQPGRQRVNFTTGHHYDSYGETGVARGKDIFTQTIEVYGPVTFENETSDTENFFVDKKADLTKAEAYVMGPTQDNDTAQKIPVSIKNSLNKDTLERDSAGIETVTYTADDGLGLSDSQQTLTKIYHFYGLPELTLTNDTIEIGEMTTKEEVSRRIGAKATVALPEGGTSNVNITNDYSNYVSTGEKITVTASFTTPDNQTRTESKTVSVKKIAGAKLEAHDITLNVGDDISDDIIKSLSELKIEHATLTKEDVAVSESIPKKDGKVTTAGSYGVVLAAHDGSNMNAIDITVRVNSLPVIEGLAPIVTREGMPIRERQGVKASYSRAGTSVDFDFSSTGKDYLSITGYESIGEDGTKQPVNALTRPGVYIITYRAATESQGEATAERTVTVHGIPVITSSDAIAIRRGESANDFLNKFKDELNIKATLIKTELKDGKTVLNTINLPTDKIEIDLSKVKFNENGSYEAIIKAVADESGIPEYTTEKKIMINVGDYQGTIPEIKTSTKERQSDDPIQNEANIKSYLLSDQMIEVKKTDYEIQSIELKSIEKQSTARAGTQIDVNDNDALKEMMTTIGVYTMTYEVMDAANNVVEAKTEFRVHGPVRFGIQNEDGSITELSSIIETRQSSGIYAGNSLVSYQMTADGKRVSAPIQMNGEASLEKVAVHEIELKGTSVTAAYENGQERPTAVMKIKLLVQGNIEFVGSDAIDTYQGSQLKNSYKAFIQTVDENGKITKTELPVTIQESVKTDTIHNGTLILEARDTMSQAPDAVQRRSIPVRVHGLPVIEVTGQTEIPQNASRDDIISLLRVRGWHISSDGQRVDLTANIYYGDISRNNDMSISIEYTDQGEVRRIEKIIRLIYTQEGVSGKDSAETGDDAKTAAYVLLMLAAAVLMTGALIRRRRQEEE